MLPFRAPTFFPQLIIVLASFSLVELTTGLQLIPKYLVATPIALVVFLVVGFIRGLRYEPGVFQPFTRAAGVGALLLGVGLVFIYLGLVSHYLGGQP